MEQAQKMTRADVAGITKQYIVENYLFGNHPESWNESDSFLGKGIIDSTGILELIEFIESRFGISIKDDEMIPRNLDSLENLSSFIIWKSEE